MGGDDNRADREGRLRTRRVSRDDLEAEFDSELAFHLEMRTRDLVEAGVDPEAAQDRARKDFGDIRSTRNGYVRARRRAERKALILGWAGGLLDDGRVALRGVRRRPAFAATVALVLALGIGATTTVFTLVRTIFFERPAHVAEPHRLVRVFRSWAPGEGGGTLEHADYLYYRDGARTLSGLAAWGSPETVSYRWEGGRPDQLAVVPVSPDYFDVLGVPAVAGRTFLHGDGAVPGEAPVAVVSHGFAARALGGAAAVLGRTLELNGLSFTVVGVAPPGFTGITPVGPPPDAWVPIAMYGALARTNPEDTAWWARHPEYRSRWLDMVGRMADGQTFEAVDADLTALATALQHPHKDPEEGIMVRRQFLYRPSQEASLNTLSRVLVGVVTLVLLIAAANATVLLLSLGTTRQREIGVRSAIGAGRGRLVRQLVVESTVLGALGGGLGIALASTSSRLAGSLLPLPFHATFRPDGTVLAWSVTLTLAVSLAAGLLPALHGIRQDAGTLLRRGVPEAGGRRARSVLVASQVALSLVLLSGALLFTRSFWTARTEDLGFERGPVVAAQVDLRSLGYDAERGLQFIDQALQRLAALPGAAAVSTTRGVPFGGQWSTNLPLPTDADPGGNADPVETGLNAVSPGYFELMGIDVVEGRALDDRDGATDLPAVVINQTLARRFWPEGDALGQLLPGRAVDYTVVGIVADATYYELGEDPWPQAYLPVQQVYQPSVYFLVRARTEAAALVEPVQAALRDLEPAVAFSTVTTLDEIVSRETARYEVSAVLVGLFGLIALILTAAGLYGTVSFAVARRTREIGVRMALGAARRDVARGVVAVSLRLVAAGAVAGLAGALILRRFTASLLYGIEATDPLPLLAAVATLVTVGVLAALIPSRRAMNVDPVEAMRAE